jgi:D-methionine transport system ATP-binding protein
MIELINIFKKFKEKDRAICAANNINLTINDEEILGIIGHSGAGKSTLLRMINYLIKPDSGIVKVDNVDLATISNKELRNLRHNMAMIFQSFNLLDLSTALENVIFALTVTKYQGDKTERAEELLNLVGLKDKKDAYPRHLSGGEKQRVAIARALACNPKYLLCDEITSALDPENTNAILNLLAKINQELKVTIILITHQMSVIQKIAKRVIVMKDGKIVEEGNVIEVISNPKQEITKKFLQELTPNIDKSFVDEDSYCLTYFKENKYENLLSELIKNYQIDVSLIESKIIKTVEGSVNNLYVSLKGQDITSALDYLTSRNVKVVKINV